MLPVWPLSNSPIGVTSVLDFWFNHSKCHFNQQWTAWPPNLMIIGVCEMREVDQAHCNQFATIKMWLFLQSGPAAHTTPMFISLVIDKRCTSYIFFNRQCMWWQPPLWTVDSDRHDNVSQNIDETYICRDKYQNNGISMESESTFSIYLTYLRSSDIKKNKTGILWFVVFAAVSAKFILSVQPLVNRMRSSEFHNSWRGGHGLTPN